MRYASIFAALAAILPALFGCDASRSRLSLNETYREATPEPLLVPDAGDQGLAPCPEALSLEFGVGRAPTDACDSGLCDLSLPGAVPPFDPCD